MSVKVARCVPEQLAHLRSCTKYSGAKFHTVGHPCREWVESNSKSVTVCSVVLDYTFPIEISGVGRRPLLRKDSICVQHSRNAFAVLDFGITKVCGRSRSVRVHCCPKKDPILRHYIKNSQTQDALAIANTGAHQK